MGTKSIFTSKTFWLNVALAGAAVVQQVTGIEIASSEIELVVAAVLNIVMRFVTVEPVKLA